jgi:hypothetical protein
VLTIRHRHRCRKASLNGSPPTSQKGDYVEKWSEFGTPYALGYGLAHARPAQRGAESKAGSRRVACGECLQVVLPSDTVTAQRAPAHFVVDVVAIQLGTTDPARVIIIQGHLDSRVAMS